MNAEKNTQKWMLQPVRRCCKGSIDERVTPAFKD